MDDDDETETVEIDGNVYEICSEIQDGAVRVARAARPPNFEMAYVVKYITDKSSDDDRARVRREIDALVRLQAIQCSSSMPIVDWDLKRLAYSMPRGDISLQEAVESNHAGTLKDISVISLALIDALKSGQALSLVHRDVKPSNVIRVSGEWRLADWGLVRNFGVATTKPGRTYGGGYGTFAYCAPEQWTAAHTADHLCDIYSLGMLIGFVVTGVEPLHNVPPELPPSSPWSTVVRRSTNLKRQERYQTYDDLENAVRTAIQQGERTPDTGRADRAARKLVSRKTPEADKPSLALEFFDEACLAYDPVLYIDRLPGVIRELNSLRLLKASLDRITRMSELHLEARLHVGSRNFSEASEVLEAYFTAAIEALRAERHAQFSSIIRFVLVSQSVWHRFDVDRRLIEWLRKFRGFGVVDVARILETEAPELRQRLRESDASTEFDFSIQQALRP